MKQKRQHPKDTAATRDRHCKTRFSKQSLTLARLHPRVLLVDHIETTAATHNLTVAIPRLKGFQRACDFHDQNFRMGSNTAVISVAECLGYRQDDSGRSTPFSPILLFQPPPRTCTLSGAAPDCGCMLNPTPHPANPQYPFGFL